MAADAINDRLISWFNSTGFPLEIQAARAFHRARFGVEQSAVYLDVEEEKGREIDLLAYRRDHTGKCVSLFAVECKAGDKPWVVLTNRSQYSRFGALWIAALSERARKVIGSKVSEYLLAYEDELGPSVGGYALKQAFAGQSDLAYAASMAALKAASAVASNEEATIAFGFPMIVVSTPIYEYSESPDGEQNFVEVPASSFEFSAYLGKQTRAVIRIVAKDHLPEYAKQCARLSERYERLFGEETQAAFAEGL